MNVSALYLILLLTLIAGCSDSRSKPKIYTTAKEDLTTQSTAAAPSSAPFASDMASTSLPDSSLAQATEPSWTPPESWTVKEPTNVRRGNFAFGPNDEVDISVTAFPGDVGGLSANVNRWRNQIGLPAADPSTIASLTEERTWAHFSGTWVELDGESLKTLAVITMVDGNSWFFKMTGPNNLVNSQMDSLNEFLNTVQFPTNE